MERALLARLGAPSWGPSGPPRAGVALASLAVPGLQLQARRDRVPRDGGVALSFGDGEAVALRVRVLVAPRPEEARSALARLLRGWQAPPVPLADPQGADLALGESASGGETVAATYGTVAVLVQRVRPSAPTAASVLARVRALLGPHGAPVFPVVSPVVSLAPGVMSPGQRVRVELRGTPLERVEARVDGGHLVAPPGPAWVELVADEPGALTVELVGTDALGRSAVATVTIQVR
ncbi:MAG: hypothetical protein HY909_17515 [Deltaproteobacteria bacterium]|nr:hypothetical protein [Deltaproteobacteria bacterium]